MYTAAQGSLRYNQTDQKRTTYLNCCTTAFPATLQVATSKIDEYARGMISGSGSTLFEELGLYYIGPMDGHNIEDLVAVMQGAWGAAALHPYHVNRG